MSPWKVILATVVIFGSGLGTGVLMVKKFTPAERPVVPQALSPAGSAPPAVPQLPKDQQKEFLRRIDTELALTVEQHDKIEKIMKAGQERTKAIREKIVPELKAEAKKQREEIRGELTPEQREKFEKSIKAKLSKKNDEAKEERRRSRQTNAPSVQP